MSPQGVVRSFYPLAGNEMAMQHNLLKGQHEGGQVQHVPMPILITLCITDIADSDNEESNLPFSEHFNASQAGSLHLHVRQQEVHRAVRRKPQSAKAKFSLAIAAA
jgi:hypothetical protein